MLDPLPAHLITGKIGEDYALQFLINHQFLILETNYRYKKSEVDIIYKSGNHIGFVEVKTRTSSHFNLAESAVDTKKQQKMYEAAQAYCLSINHSGSVKFDILVIEITPKVKTILYYPDSFFPMPQIDWLEGQNRF